MKRYWILLPLILLAFFLRVWQLPHTPPGLWYDEAYYSMDATWLLDGGSWRLFFSGNNGREPLFIYLQVPFVWLFGSTPLTSRLIGALTGVLTVPLVYVLARRLTNLRHHTISTFAPYLATAGIAISYWHLTLSRSGFRAILWPLVAAFVFYAFWRGWQDAGRSPKWLALAGLGLGIGQYTYLAARALPLVFAIFALIWTLLNRRNLKSGGLATLWSGLAVMALLSAVVFAPLGWYFYQNPQLFSARTGDVFFTPNSPTELFQHLSNALRLFFDGGDPGWRHNFQGRPMLGWLGWLGFWPGLFICLRHLRRANYLFLVVALSTLYLPALLATPPAHALRLAALLPIYYIIFAVGLIELAGFIFFIFHRRSTPSVSPRPLRLFVILLASALITLETGLTFFDYFYRWANAEETYVEFNGPLVDFIDYIVDRTAETPVIIPFQLYVHPTTRYLLHDHFTEQPSPVDLTGPAQLVTLPNDFRMLNVANIPTTPAWVWLSHDGVAYVSRPPRLEEQTYLDQVLASPEAEIFRDRFGRELAHLRRLVDPSPLFPIFTETTSKRAINLSWDSTPEGDNLAQLNGYEVWPEVIQPGQPLTLNFYWHSLTDKTFDARLFLQLIDQAGNPINQWEGEAFREDMYRWRPDGILPSQHTLWIGPDTPPGPYLVRLGFFDGKTGRRLPLHIETPMRQNEAGEGDDKTIDQIQLGLFYVSPKGVDPRIPTTPLSATFGDSIKLTGVTLPSSETLTQSLYLPTPKIPVTFHWQSLHPSDKPYTVFLQLLDEQNKVVAGWDSQPFGGLYPTNLWSPGEMVVAPFSLPLPNEGLPSGVYRLITGFYDVATGLRLPVDGGNDFVELTRFGIE